MLKLRNILDVFFVIGVFMFIVSGTIYFLFIRWREKQLLKRSIKGSTVGLILLLIGNGLINMIPAFREKIWGNYFGRGFEDGDVLMIIFKKSFPLHSTVFVTLVSLLIMAVIIYATWQFVGSKKMFQRV